MENSGTSACGEFAKVNLLLHNTSLYFSLCCKSAQVFPTKLQLYFQQHNRFIGFNFRLYSINNCALMLKANLSLSCIPACTKVDIGSNGEAPFLITIFVGEQASWNLVTTSSLRPSQSKPDGTWIACNWSGSS